MSAAVRFQTVLGVVALFSLWGVFLVNSQGVRMVKTMLTGLLPLSDGEKSPFRFSYTGIPGLDFNIAFLTSFWAEITKSRDVKTRLLLLDLFSSAWCYQAVTIVEEAKNPAGIWASSAFIGYLYQNMSAALVMPFWYRKNLSGTSSPAASSTYSNGIGFGILLACILGGVAPYLGVFYPEILGQRLGIELDDSDAAHQLRVGVWQGFPIIMSGIAFAIAYPFKKRTRSLSLSFLVTALISATAHYNVIASAIANGISFREIYIPSFIPQATTLPEGSLVFSQCDHIILSLASIHWVSVVVSRATGYAFPLVFSAAAVSTVLFGPGASVLCFLVLKDRLQESGAEHKKFESVIKKTL